MFKSGFKIIIIIIIIITIIIMIIINALNMNLDSIFYQKDFVFRNLYYCTTWIEDMLGTAYNYSNAETLFSSTS